MHAADHSRFIQFHVVYTLNTVHIHDTSITANHANIKYKNKNKNNNVHIKMRKRSKQKKRRKIVTLKCYCPQNSTVKTRCFHFSFIFENIIAGQCDCLLWDWIVEEEQQNKREEKKKKKKPQCYMEYAVNDVKQLKYMNKRNIQWLLRASFTMYGFIILVFIFISSFFFHFVFFESIFAFLSIISHSLRVRMH